MSAPRSRCSFSWFVSIVSRISSSLMSAGGADGAVRILEARHLLIAELLMRRRRGRVVAVAIDDHAGASSASRPQRSMASSISVESLGLRPRRDTAAAHS